MSTSTLRRRIEALETATEGRIETLADFVLWRVKGGTGRPKFSPKMEEVFSAFLLKIKE